MVRVSVAIILMGNVALAQDDPCAKEGAALEAVQRVNHGAGQGAAMRALASCEKEAARKEEQRKKEERDRIEAEKNRAETERRKQAEAAAAQASKDEEARDNAITDDPRAMRAIFGAILCIFSEGRKAALAEIATQRKYSRIGGVQNNLALLELQNRIRKIDEQEREERRTLKTYDGIIPGKCSNKDVMALLSCRKDRDRKGCDVEPIPGMVAFLQKEDGLFREAEE